LYQEAYSFKNYFYGKKAFRLLQVAYVKLAMFLYKDGSNNYSGCKFILDFMENIPEILELILQLMV